MHKADVAVIIPLYNRAQFIEYTIQSIQSQMYPYWEAIIVDDGSTDGSVTLVEKLASEDSRIKLLKRERLPKGASVCRNIGLEYTSCQYILFLDSDDLLAPHCLSDRVADMKANPHLDFVVYSMLLFKEKPDDIGILWNIATEEDDLARFLRMDAVWQTSCPLYTKKILTTIGGFDETLPFLQDYDLHVRILFANPTYIKRMNEPPDCFWRKHLGESISQKGFRDTKVSFIKQRIFKKIATQITNGNFTKHFNSIAALFFLLSKEWITFYSNISESLMCWENARNFVTKNIYLQAIHYLNQYYFLQKEGYKETQYEVTLKPIEILLPENFFFSKSFLYLFSQQELEKINAIDPYPIITVIIPNDNNSSELPQRIQNVINQSYSFIEIIIIDNCSTDNSRKIIEKYALQDSRIRIVFNTDKINYWQLWKQGVTIARGEYVWVAEPGSYAENSFLLELKKAFKKEYGSISTKSWIVDKSHAILDIWEEDLNKPQKKNHKTNTVKTGNSYLVYRNVIPLASAVLFKKDILHNMLSGEIRSLNYDWLWAKMLFSSKLALLDKVLNYIQIQQYTQVENKIKTGQAIKAISELAAQSADFGKLSPKLQNKITTTLTYDLIINIIKGSVTFQDGIFIYQNLRKVEPKINKLIILQALHLFYNRKDRQRDNG